MFSSFRVLVHFTWKIFECSGIFFQSYLKMFCVCIKTKNIETTTFKVFTSKIHSNLRKTIRYFWWNLFEFCLGCILFHFLLHGLRFCKTVIVAELKNSDFLQITFKIEMSIHSSRGKKTNNTVCLFSSCVKDGNFCKNCMQKIRILKFSDWTTLIYAKYF